MRPDANGRRSQGTSLYPPTPPHRTPRPWKGGVLGQGKGQWKMKWGWEPASAEVAGALRSPAEEGTGILAPLCGSTAETNRASTSALELPRLATESAPPPNTQLQPQDPAGSQTLLEEGAEWGGRGPRRGRS